MPSKKITQQKIRSSLLPEYTKQFTKDWNRLKRSGICDLTRLRVLMEKLIANEGPLDLIHREHELIGNWAGYHECHMGGDVLLIYRKTETTIVFTRAGSHAALFEN